MVRIRDRAIKFWSKILGVGVSGAGPWEPFLPIQ